MTTRRGLLSKLMLAAFAATGCGSDTDGGPEALSPAATPPPNLSQSGNVGNVTISIIGASFWRDWMPEVSKPGPDGGSPLQSRISIRLDSDDANDSVLSFDVRIYDANKQVYATRYSVKSGPGERAWDGRLSAQSDVVELVTREGAYLPVGEKVVAVINWSDQNGNTGSVVTREAEVRRVD